LVGCGEQASDTSDADAASDALAEVDTSKTMKIVCTNESYQTLFDTFTSETGIKTEFISMSSGEVLSKLRAEGGTPSADLWFGGGIDSFMTAATDGLLEAVDFPDADRFAAGFKSPENLWFSKGVTVVGFIANKGTLESINAAKPEAWTDLPNSEYKDELIMSSPAVSGTNFAAVAGILQDMGEDEGWKLLEGINANIPFYTKRGSDPSTRVAAGEFAVGITYLDNTLDELVTSNDCELIYPSDGMPYIPDGVAAFKGGEDVAAAKYFIEWLFSSDENLEELAKIDQKNTIKLCIPSLTNIKLDFDENNLMKEDIEEFGDIREDVLAKWDEITAGKETLTS
jgi:iron(III) transport system substrate-binding protein